MRRDLVMTGPKVGLGDAPSSEISKRILDQIGEAIFHIDLKGEILWWNKAAEQLSGRTGAEFKNQPIESALPLFFQQAQFKYDDIIKQIQTSGHPVEISQRITLQPKSSGDIFVEMSALPYVSSPTSNAPIDGILVILRDVNQKVKVQEEQLKRGHLKSMGIFAGRIAHEFNNILTALLGNISLAKNLIGENAEMRELLSGAEQAGERARNITLQLFAVARDGTVIKMLVPVVQILQRSIDEVLSKTEIKLKVDLVKDLWLIEVDEDQIVQAINQVLQNAKEALGGKGSVEIRAENFVIGGPSAVPLKPQDYVKIIIKDNGPGIKPEYVSKIFDPFFTTKPNHSGLGLATAFSAIITHDGFMTGEFPEYQGAVFYIFLPAVRQRQRFVKIVEEQKPPSPEAPMRILVMDDEEIICKVAIKVLNHLGFKGTTAANGEEAISIYKQAKDVGQPFDAVILDLTIVNGMGGVDALKEMIKIDPNIKAIVSTGFTNHPIMSNYQEHGFKGVLAKPYTATELEKVLAKIAQDQNDKK